MKVLHITPSFYPATHYGGPIYSGYALCNSLARLSDLELRVLTTDSDGPKRLRLKSPQRQLGGYDTYYCRRWIQPDISPGLFLRLLPMVRWADLVHLTAVYSAPTIPTLLLCRLLQKPVVWSTRGALQRWDASTRTGIKSVWEKICDGLCDLDRVMLHVTSQEERSESCERIRNARAVVVPNGVDLPELSHDQRSRNVLQRILYLGRLHPIKGIENLLHAMARLRHGVRLSICGDGEPDYRAKLESLSEELGLRGRVEFHGHVEGEVKEQQFRNADICIVPSFKENFCVVVAEALARGVPVIASHGTPWKRLEEMGCGLWVDNDAESLADAITRAADLPLREMGLRGREWMKREFSWEVIAERMADEYRALIETSGGKATVEAVTRQAA